MWFDKLTETEKKGMNMKRRPSGRMMRMMKVSHGFAK